MAIERFDRPITRNEISSFKTYMQARPASDDSAGDDWVYGTSGGDTEALGLVSEVTSDTAILDQMTRFADAALGCRNDPATGRIGRTLRRELCRPNQAPCRTDGGFEVALSWKDGKLISGTTHSGPGSPCKLRYCGKWVGFPTSPNKTHQLDNDLNQRGAL